MQNFSFRIPLEGEGSKVPCYFFQTMIKTLNSHKPKAFEGSFLNVTSIIIWRFNNTTFFDTDSHYLYSSDALQQVHVTYDSIVATL